MTNFKKNRIKKRKYKRRTKNTFFDKIIFRSIIVFLLMIIWLFVFTYFKYIYTLPKITSLEEIKIPEASIIYDRNWKKLYTLYSWEKRTYVDYNTISKNIINAITSAEDKTFFTNDWIDLKWIFRAVFNYAINKTSQIEWTSTISQQLIKNIFLSNDRKIVRKIREIYLSYKLNQTYTKEKILELYLNKISFWSNAFWIEQASLTFFWKKSNNLSVLEASILSSLPKWPTYYSPYNHPDRLLWYIYKYKKDNKKKITKVMSKEKINSSNLSKEFIKYINWLKWKRLKNNPNKILLCWINENYYKKEIRLSDWCYVFKYSDLLWFLNNIQIKSNESILEYQTWRKDFVLWRMLEDDKITFKEYQKALIDSFWFEFKKYTEEIKAPHFVFYVKEYLEEKYWKNILWKEWLHIYTTLDLDYQEKAEKIIKEKVKINKTKFDASNWALVTIDNKTWEIITMVWSVDYFNKDIDGNVNVITSKRQPWSTFKPFVYAKAIENNKIGSNTPVFDLQTEFPWKYIPHNYDWKYNWLMSIMTALNYSRNIPAIKMYFLWGEQKEIMSFMEKLWVKSLNKNFYYWAPMAIGTWEMTPLELARAYSVFANMWIKKDSSPILKIEDSKWNIIEKKENQWYWKKVMNENLAFIMNNILSSTFARPNNFWNNYLSLKDRQAAAKTGTSNKITSRKDKKWNNIILPWDMWTIWYTPQYTTVVWTWNTDWSEMNYKWNWLEWAWPIWKDFMEYIHKWKEKLLWKKPSWVKEINISKISGKLVHDDFNKDLTVKSLFLSKNLPDEYDNSLKEIKIDKLCNWIVTSKTPKWAIDTWYYVDFHSLMPYKEKWEEPVKKWINEWWAKEYLKWANNIIASYNPEPCKRDSKKLNNAKISFNVNIKEKDILSSGDNYFKIDYNSYNQLRNITISINWKTLKNISTEYLDKKWVIDWYFNIPRIYIWKRVKLTIKITDEIYFSTQKTINIWVIKQVFEKPKIIITNPIDWDKVLYLNQHFNLRWEIKDRNKIKSINIYLDWKPLKYWMTDRIFSYPINQDHNLKIWEHIIKVEAINSWYKKETKEIKLTIIPQ